MGRTAGAALKVVAPEAAVASKVASAGGRRRSASDPRVSAPGSKAAQQREAIEQLKAERPPEPTPDPVTAADGPPPTSLGGGPSLPSIPAPVQSGSGFLLGVFAWAVGLAYLQGGSAGVKKFMAAKFFNKT